MAQSCCKNLGLARIVQPNHRVIFFGVLTIGGGQRGGRWPEPGWHIKLVFRIQPSGWYAGHDGMVLGDCPDGKVAILFMVSTCHAKSLTPGIRLGRTIAVGGAMEHHGWHPVLEMGIGVGFHKGIVADFAKAFVVDNHIIIFPEIRLCIDTNFVTPCFVAFMNNVKDK